MSGRLEELDSKEALDNPGVSAATDSPGSKMKRKWAARPSAYTEMEDLNEAPAKLRKAGGEKASNIGYASNEGDEQGARFDEGKSQGKRRQKCDAPRTIEDVERKEKMAPASSPGNLSQKTSGSGASEAKGSPKPARRPAPRTKGVRKRRAPVRRQYGKRTRRPQKANPRRPRVTRGRYKTRAATLRAKARPYRTSRQVRPQSRARPRKQRTAQSESVVQDELGEVDHPKRSRTKTPSSQVDQQRSHAKKRQSRYRS